jgi:hypothetical protein
MRGSTGALGWVVLGGALLLPGGVGAQTSGASSGTPPVRDTASVHGWSLGTLGDELARVLEITGAARVGSPMARRLSVPRGERDRFIELAPVRAGVVYNTGYPSGLNDGLLWSGRGVSGLLSGGVRMRWGPFSAAIAPEVAQQQNSEFDLRQVARPGYSPYVDPFTSGLDMPQRFGDDSFASAAPGQSYARVDVRGFTAGISTENLWWGPAMRYPLLMSSTAPGFPHVFAGTSRPIAVGIGTLAAELIWGRLTESDYYDEIVENDRSGLAALVAAFSPYGLRGLSLGFARVYQFRSDAGEWLRDPSPITAVFGGAGANRPGNEMFSVFGRWVFEESGAEVYGEWGRDDRWLDLAELVQEPDHSQAYMVGFQKVTDVGRGTAVRVHGELIGLQELAELRGSSRPLPVWYTNSQVRQGYSHWGQLLGAGVGPGADAQFLGVDALRGWGMAGLFLERIRRNTATGAALGGRRYSPREHDTELVIGVRGLYLDLRDLSISGRVSFAYRFNRNFEDDDRNVGIELRAAWSPSAGLAW